MARYAFLDTPPPLSQPSAYIDDINWLADDFHEFIVFMGYVNFTSRYISGDLYRINASTLTAERLSSGFDGIGSVMSPDETAILYQAYTSDRRLLSTFMMNIEENTRWQLTTSIQFTFDASWSPDGELIPLAGGSDELKFDIYRMSVGDTEYRNLTLSTDVYEFDPEWSPAGSEIVYVTRPDLADDNTEIHVMSADGTDMTQLTHNSYWDSSAHWRPLISSDARTTQCP